MTPKNICNWLTLWEIKDEILFRYSDLIWSNRDHILLEMEYDNLQSHLSIFEILALLVPTQQSFEMIPNTDEHSLNTLDVK